MSRTADRMSFFREMFVIGGSLIMASVASMLFASWLDGLKDRKKNKSVVCKVSSFDYFLVKFKF